MWRRFRQILVFDRWDGLLGVAEGVLHLVKGLGEPLLWPQMPQKRNPLLPSWRWCDRSQWGRSCCWCLRNFFRLRSLDIFIDFRDLRGEDLLVRAAYHLVLGCCWLGWYSRLLRPFAFIFSFEPLLQELSHLDNRCEFAIVACLVACLVYPINGFNYKLESLYYWITTTLLLSDGRLPCDVVTRYCWTAYVVEWKVE